MDLDSFGGQNSRSARLASQASAAPVKGARYERQRLCKNIPSRPAAAGAAPERETARRRAAADPLLAQPADHLDALQFRMADHAGQWRSWPRRGDLRTGGD